ncbi:auxin-responsive protein SAUR36-like [Ananas comosus]|uniref:Auxin-responsive protein SAUR36 n=1 Tax=Ananas comosus TaxID=4615 RepID=A0A199USC6_ANACO|nr:auxin-responsive protein SAUR36-like [Ananas comosus]OAY67703.1 Auxin-responsive protein SAUR36 [Ananas comosus]
MVNPKRLVEAARRWNKVAAQGRGASRKGGHFAAYTKDGCRFLVPIDYLNSSIFRELLEKSEEEFGVAGGRPIVLPCDAVFIEHIMATLQTTARFRRNVCDQHC